MQTDSGKNILERVGLRGEGNPGVGESGLGGGGGGVEGDPGVGERF